MSHPRPVSLIAERAVRYLRKKGSPVGSRTLARELLSTRTANADVARGLLRSAFDGDPRLVCEGGQWSVSELASRDTAAVRIAVVEPDRVLVFVHGGRTNHPKPYVLKTVAALRFHDEDVVAACGGDAIDGRYGNRLRRAMLEILDGAIPVTHASKTGLGALERWIGEPLASQISLRRLGRERVVVDNSVPVPQAKSPIRIDARLSASDQVSPTIGT